MKLLPAIISVSLFIILTTVSHGQEGELTEIIAAIAEELAENESDPEAAELISDRLQELSENPVRLNSADETEMSRLFFLSDFQIKSLAEYVHSSGTIYSVFEIANIPGFDRELTSMMIPFITLSAAQGVLPDTTLLRSTFLTNASIRSTGEKGEGAGSQWKFLSKYRFRAGGFSGGLTAEKDPGEKFLTGTPPRPDFFSAFLSWTGKGIVKKIVIGDFSARFGQGTNLNTGIRTGMSLTSAGYLQGGDEIRPYTSAGENNFFRGPAIQLQYKNAGASLFWSVNKIDASCETAGDSLQNYITAFTTTGIHDTPASLQKKDAVTETAWGASFSYNFKNLKTGILFSECRLSYPIGSRDNNLQDFFDFEGTETHVATVYYKALLGRMILYGEASEGSKKKMAFVQGMSFRPSDRLTLNMLYRYYDAGFTSFHGNGPFSSSSGSNLHGIFGNFTFEAAKHLFISAGTDIRHYPWLKYRCSAPSTAYSSDVRIKYLPSAKLLLELLCSSRFSMQDRQEEDRNGIINQEEIISRAIRGVIKYSPDENLHFTTRMDYRKVSPSGSTAILLLQDINFSFSSFPVSLWMRYCIFNTGSWDSRLYTYENDLVHSFSIPALYGRGSRSYIMAGWKISGNAETRIKFAVTSLLEDNTSCKETTDLRIQLRLWF